MRKKNYLKAKTKDFSNFLVLISFLNCCDLQEVKNKMSVVICNLNDDF